MQLKRKTFERVYCIDHKQSKKERRRESTFSFFLLAILAEHQLAGDGKSQLVKLCPSAGTCARVCCSQDAQDQLLGTNL